MKHNKTTKTDYLLVFFLLGISTIPFLKKGAFALVVLIILLGILYKKLVIKNELIFVVAVVTILEIFHFFYYPGYEFSVLRDQILYFIIAGLIIYYLKLRFLDIYLDIITFFTWVSFPIFSLYYINKDLVIQFSKLFSPLFLSVERSVFYQYERISPIFYTFDGNFLILGRNNGPFWEPTVFATMLILAQIFNLFLTKRLFNKRGIIFSIAILTTFSTTGYISYLLLITVQILITRRIRFEYKVFLYIAMFTSALVFFTKLSFLESKIKGELQNVSTDISEKGGDSRLASAILDWQEIKNDPIALLFGKGNSKSSRTLIKDTDIVVMRNCGDTALLVQWGGFFTFAYFGLIFYSFYGLNRFYGHHSVVLPIVLTLIVLICGFSETFFELPFFHVFLFIGPIIKHYYNSRNRINLKKNEKHFNSDTHIQSPANNKARFKITF